MTTLGMIYRWGYGEMTQDRCNALWQAGQAGQTEQAGQHRPDREAVLLAEIREQRPYRLAGVVYCRPGIWRSWGRSWGRVPAWVWVWLAGVLLAGVILAS